MKTIRCVRTDSPNRLICLLALLWALLAGASSVQAQYNCDDYPGLTDSYWPQCCFNHRQCFASAQCAFSSEYPYATADACAVCNQQMAWCLGRNSLLKAKDGTGVKWYPEGPVISSCTPQCSYSGVRCGAPDSCNGFCTGPDLCGLLARRPEFVVVF